MGSEGFGFIINFPSSSWTATGGGGIEMSRFCLAIKIGKPERSKNLKKDVDKYYEFLLRSVDTNARVKSWNRYKLSGAFFLGTPIGIWYLFSESHR